jgi:transketolase
VEVKVDNLVGLVDCNRIQAPAHLRDFRHPGTARKSGPPSLERHRDRGTTWPQIVDALEKAETVKGRPTFVHREYRKGKDFSFAENNAAFKTES